MSYRIRLTRRAARDIDQLPTSIRAAVLALIDDEDGLRGQPKQRGRRLQAPFDGLWTAARTEYRIVYRVDDGANAVLVEHVNLRPKGS